MENLFKKNELGFAIVSPDPEEIRKWKEVAAHAGWRPIYGVRNSRQLARVQLESLETMARVVIDTKNVPSSLYEVAINIFSGVSVGLLYKKEEEKRAAGAFKTSQLRPPGKKIQFLETEADAYNFTIAPILYESTVAKVLMYGAVWARRAMEVAMSCTGWGSDRVENADDFPADQVLNRVLDPTIKAIITTGDYAPGTAVDMLGRNNVKTELVTPISFGDRVVGDIVANKIRYDGIKPVIHLPGVKESLDGALLPLAHILRCVAIGLAAIE